ncbi:hypothetical protein DV737_g1923, partial [Chaetothyriales sp. CBS 132003]
MVFLFSRNFRDHRLLRSSLQSFFGIGPSLSGRILARFHLHDYIRMRDLSQGQILELNAFLDSLGKTEDTRTLKIENELRRDILRNIQRLKDTGTYRGRRHAMNLPVRGQNTRSQIKTAWRLNRVDRRL